MREPASSHARQALTGLVCAVGVGVVGLPVGVLWSALAPRAALVSTAAGVDYADSETKDFITADGYLFLLCVAAGILCAVLVWFLARRRGLWTLLGLAAGAGAGAYLASRVGVHGTSRAAVLAAARAGREPARFALPLQLHATTVLLVWPGAAALTWAVLVFRSPAPPRTLPVPPDQEPAGQPLSSG